MRKLALAVAATFMLAVVAPAFSQPFADVPTDHWAFDAIAELAAKGIVEGYPDGTFKGDRAMTRYEIAMVVARILARIEAIKIPAPPPPVKIPPPEVGRADIAALQRLVNEFRAELAALGVRVTAVEEELAALKARLDNTRVTGATRFRYQYTQATAGATANLRTRLQFTGRVGSHITVVTRLAVGSSGAGGFTFATPAALASPFFDLAYVDWAGPFGTSWRVGQFTYTLGTNGLLFDTGSMPVGFGAGGRVSGSFGPVSLTLAAFRDSATLDIWTISAGGALIPGWRTNVHYYSARPVPAATAATGFGLDISGRVVPGVTFAVDWASYTAAGGAAQTALRADLTFSLAQFGMAQFSPTLGVFYKNYGPTAPTAVAGPLYSAAYTQVIGTNTWNLTTWGAQLEATFNPRWSGRLIYESGTIKSTSAAISEWHARARYQLGHGATLDFIYFTQSVGGAVVPSNTVYRIEMNYSW